MTQRAGISTEIAIDLKIYETTTFTHIYPACDGGQRKRWPAYEYPTKKSNFS